MQEIESKIPIESGFKNNLLSIKNISEMQFPDNEWLVEKIVPLQGITIVSGAPGSYKTWLIWQMAINIAEGARFLEQFQCNQSSILIIDEENHLRLVRDRFRMLRASTELPIHFLSQQGLSVLKNDSIKEIIEMCKNNNIGTVFIDSLVRISHADENDAQQMAKVLGVIKGFCQAGITVIVTHHERKEGINKGSGLNRLRGSSDIPAAIDSHVSVRKSKDNKKIILVEQPKLRMSEELEPFSISVTTEDDTIKFKFEGAPVNELTNEIKELIIEILGEDENKQGLSIAEITEEVRKSIKVGKQAPGKVVNELIKEGVIESKPGLKNAKICFLAENAPTSLL